MKKNYGFQKILLLLSFFLLGSIAANAQGDEPGVKPHSKYSLIPVPAGLTYTQLPISTPVYIFKGAVVYGNVVSPTSYLYSFDIDDPPNWSLIADVNYVSLSGDFRSDDPDHMWIIDSNDNYLKRILITNGAVIDSVAMPCPLVDGIWTCITFQKTTGQLYAIATSTVTPDSRLYEVDQITGLATELFELGAVAIISGTFDMYGILYVFDIYEDITYTINILSQSIDSLGPAGFDGNFAQGMGNNPETNEVYLAAWHEGVGAELRLLDKSTGATTLISTLPGETTAFGFPVIHIPQTYYSVTDVYTDQTIDNGDTLWVLGFYTNPDRNLLINFYGDLLKRQIMPPQSYLFTEGIVPPTEAWNGGYLIAKGTVQFIVNPDPYWMEDTLTAFLDIFETEVLINGSGPSIKQKSGSIDKKIFENQQNKGTKDCDSCKFAILISGGINSDNNQPQFWEDLVALYNFKVNSQGYCEDNVFVHYFEGNREDDRIPQAQVIRADSAHIADSHTEVSRRVGNCTRNNQPASFQKMVTNHGNPDGSISLLEKEALAMTDLKDMQQKIIDSCCTLVMDEFTQCFGGYGVDTMSTLDTKNKATIYANSAADHIIAYGPEGEVTPYLQGKINSLQNGDDYEDAVVAGKMAYDEFLRDLIDTTQNILEELDNLLNNAIAAEEWNQAFEIMKLIIEVNDFKEDLSNAICKSRNVTVTPFNEYCQLQKYVIPPGGQLVLDFEGENQHCGNVTIYWIDSVTGAIKYKVFNWNIEGSSGYSGNNKRRVVNGGEGGPTTFWVHNDDGTFKVTASANGNQDLPEDNSNTYTYPGASFGGNDDSNAEFAILTQPEIWIEDIDQVPFSLNNLPAQMGMGYPAFLGGSFTIDPTDDYASSMELHIDIVEIQQPGMLMVNSSGSLFTIPVYINEPGEYDIPLGDLRPGGPDAFIEMSTYGAAFSIDCWGIHSVYQPIHELLLDLNVFLEGPFNGTNMNTNLNPSIIPLSQPYNTDPWNYPGTESVGSIPNTEVVDWVLIELRDTTDASLATGETVIAQQAAFLLNNGSIVGTDGSSVLQFDNSITNQLFVVVWHRNHLGIMSANALTETGGVYTYDFTTGNNQAYGTDAQVDLGSGMYGMIGGDANADGFVNNDDKTEVWNSETGETGYLGSDVDMDGQANNLDKNDTWINNISSHSQVPD